ncbi:MAG: radical SAM protein [Thermoproteota archaeon]
MFPSFFPFTVESSCYIFEQSSNLLIEVPKNDWELVLNILESASDRSDLTRLILEEAKNSENPGFFKMLAELNTFLGTMETFLEKTVESGDFSESEIYEYILRNGLREMILEITSECNLRCKYCLFSGNYKGFRTHSTIKMSSEIALRAIDMYFEYLELGSIYNPQREPVIGFYGGEPLLNFRLIKDVVNYVKQNYSKRYQISFTITTNGTLLTSEIIDFLLSNNFSIFVSLDGPREEHDRNRIYANGKGSFDIVIKNVKMIYERAKELHLNAAPTVYALVTYDIKTDLLKAMEFFDKESPIKPILINPVSSVGTEYYRQFSKDCWEEFLRKRAILEKTFLEYVEGKEYRKKNFVPFIESFYRALMFNFYRNLFQRNLLRYTSPCIPGYKIFVDTMGVLHPCERVPNNISMGNIDKGLDFEAIKRMLVNYRKILNDCYKCPIAYTCQKCFANMEEDCRKIKKSFFEDLKIALKLYKRDPTYFSSRLKVYADRYNYIDFK